MISENLPYNWHAATFEDVLADISNGIPAPQNKEFNGIPVSRIETIAAGNVNLSKIGYVANIDEAEADRYLLAPGDILFSHINSPTHIGKTAIFRSGKLYHGTNLLRIKTERSACIPEYFEYYCRYFRSVGEFSINAQHAVNQSSLNQKKIKAFPLPLAPLAEQTRIAAKLDELLAQVDRLKARIDGIPALLKRFRQSVLAAAVSGRLTEEWRLKTVSCAASSEMRLGDESLMVPTSWKKTLLGDVTKKDRKLCYGVIQPGPEVEKGVDLIRVCDIKDGTIDWGRLRKINNGIDAEYSRSRVREGDIVISIVGTIGRAAIVREDRNANIARAVALISVEQELVLPSWAYIWLTAPVSQWWLTSSSKEVARKTLNLKELIEMPVPRPSIAEQTEIVRRVEQLFAFADQLEARLKAAQAHIDRLTQSILAKAFRGELVPQDPNDEPASVLLDRIKAQRAAAPKAKRGRSKTVV